MHELVASTFGGEPWHVCSTYTGIKGVTAAAARGAEVVLIDVDLPDMNGFDVCRHLREVSAPSAVIFLTASASVDERLCSLPLGAVDYVTKPFDAAVRVRNSLRTRRLPEQTPTAHHPGRRPRRAAGGGSRRAD